MSKREEYNLVVAVEWRRTGIRTFLAIPHGGIPQWTTSIRSAYVVSREHWQECLEYQPLRDNLSAWKLMTQEEAEAWKAIWPKDDPLLLRDIPYWE